MRTHVYIDGFNLYYGAIKGTNFHWLDLCKVCDLLLPDHRVEAVKYYTAIVSDRPDDPQKSLRQQIYIRALRSMPRMTITLGQFLSHRVSMRLCEPGPHGEKFARVWRTEEKGTDACLATHLLHDAHLDSYDVAVLISNDSDLLEPVRLVRDVLKKQVGIVNPRQTNPSKELMRHADFIRQLRAGLLEKCRLPSSLRDAKGEIRCPDKWAGKSAG